MSHVHVQTIELLIETLKEEHPLVTENLEDALAQLKMEIEDGGGN